MDYFLMPLTVKEAREPKNKGYRFATENKDRWIDLGEAKDEVNTYDKGTTVLVYKDKPYNIFKDYVSIDAKFRVYIGCDLDATYDKLTVDTEESSDATE